MTHLNLSPYLHYSLHLGTKRHQGGGKMFRHQMETLAIFYNKPVMPCKAVENNAKGKERFAEWKKVISFLAQNVPQASKYREWDKLEYD